MGEFLGPFAGRDDALTTMIELPEGATNAEITFDLLILDSWDGTHPGYSDTSSGGRGDGMSFTVDGVEIAFTNFIHTASTSASGSFDVNGSA